MSRIHAHEGTVAEWRELLQWAIDRADDTECGVVVTVRRDKDGDRVIDVKPWWPKDADRSLMSIGALDCARHHLSEDCFRWIGPVDKDA